MRGLRTACLGNHGSTNALVSAESNKRSGSEAPWSFEIYEGSDLHLEFLQNRLKQTLDWIDALEMPPSSAALDVGCGVGILTAKLAGRGLRVTAIDSSSHMINLTRHRVNANGLSLEVTAAVGDVEHLDLPDMAFDLVTAIGLVGWMGSPSAGIGEMARVLRPGGSLIFTCGHPGGIKHFIEPTSNPLLAPLCRVGQRLLLRMGMKEPQPSPHRYSIRHLKRLTSSAGLDLIELRTVGFGPLTIFGRPLVPRAFGSKLNTTLQKLADNGMPAVRSAGMTCIILARRPAKLSMSPASLHSAR